MKILGFEFGKKSVPPQETITPPGLTSPASGSPEAQQATANQLAQNLANLRSNAAMAKEPGVASVDGPAISAIEQQLAATGVTPTVSPEVKSAKFSTPPPPPTRFGQGKVPKPSTATTESLVANVANLANADEESEATSIIPPASDKAA